MKRILSVFLALFLLAGTLPALAEEAPDETFFASHAWVSTSGARLTLNGDGTGMLVNGELNLEGTWILDCFTVTFSYQLYGDRTMALEWHREDGTDILVSGEGAVFYPEENLPETKAETTAAYPAAWGEKINVGFADMTLTEFQVMRKIQGKSNVGYLEPESEGSKYLVAVGTISNNSGAAVNRKTIAVTMVVDDKNTYTGKAYMEYNDSLVQELPAAGSGRLFLYTSVPDSIAESFSKVRIEFGFNNNFDPAPSAPGAASFCFSLDVDTDMAAKSRETPAREKVFYEESPSMPVPTSYIDVKESGHSSSKSNGKVTKNEYRYRLEYKNDDGSKVFPEYITGLQLDGYKVETSGGDYVVSNGGKKLATVSFDNAQLTVNVTPGNETLTTLPEKKEGAAVTAPEEIQEVQLPTVRLGGTIRTSYLEMTLKKAGHTTELLSYTSSKKPRNWRYYEPNSTANELFYILGTFKNNTGAEVNISNLYTEIDFDGKNIYNASTTSLYGDGRGFTTSVVSGDTVEFYIYAEVPKSVLNSYKNCTVKIGMSSDFRYRSLRNERLQFDNCEDVYVLDLSDMPLGVEIPNEIPVKVTDIRTGKNPSITFINQSKEAIKEVTFRIRYYDKEGNLLFADEAGKFNIDGYYINENPAVYEAQVAAGKKATIKCSGDTLFKQAYRVEISLSSFVLAKEGQLFDVPESAMCWYDSASKNYSGDTNFKCLYVDNGMLDHAGQIMMGFTAITITPRFMEHYGLYDTGLMIVEIHYAALGGQAGLDLGDIITQVNGVDPMEDSYALFRGKDQLLDGKPLELTVNRWGKELTITITPDMI